MSFHIGSAPVDWGARIAALEQDPRVLQLIPRSWPVVRVVLHELQQAIDADPDGASAIDAAVGLREIFDELACIDLLDRSGAGVPPFLVTASTARAH